MLLELGEALPRVPLRGGCGSPPGSSDLRNGEDSDSMDKGVQDLAVPFGERWYLPTRHRVSVSFRSLAALGQCKTANSTNSEVPCAE